MTSEDNTPPLIDLHSHLLPGVDDGSATPELSAQVAAKFWNEGVRQLCLTPHILLSETAGASRAAVLARFDANPPASLYAAPSARQRSVLKDPGALKKLTI